MKLLALCLALVAVAGTATVWVLWQDGWISAQSQWDTTVQQRMDDIETVGERDGWRCGLCHTPADHLYFIELHDDGTLCCAVCAQILDAGALE